MCSAQVPPGNRKQHQDVEGEVIMSSPIIGKVGAWCVSGIVGGLVMGAAFAADLVGEFPKPISGKCKQTSEGVLCKGKGRLVVRNEGTSNSVPTTVTFYLSDSCTPLDGDPQIGDTVTLKVIKPGKTGKATMKGSPPVNTNPSGKVIVAVIGDPLNNNTACSEPIQ
jgi:hypothetical protein